MSKTATARRTRASACTLSGGSNSISVLVAATTMCNSGAAPTNTLAFTRPLAGLVFGMGTKIKLTGSMGLASVRLLNVDIPRGVGLNAGRILFKATRRIRMPVVFASTVAAARRATDATMVMGPVDKGFGVGIMAGGGACSDIRMALSSMTRRTSNGNITCAMALAFESRVSADTSIAR